MNVPKTFWFEAVLIVSYIINRMPSQVLASQSPISILCSDSHLFLIPPKIFGCVCFVHTQQRDITKLDPKAVKCVFLVYPSSKKWYKCYHPNTGKNFVSMDVTFFELVPFFSSSSPSLQGEPKGEERESSSLSLPNNLSFSVSIHPSPFDNQLGRGKELLVYKKKKDTATPPLPIDSSEPDNVLLSSLHPINDPSKPDDDLQITLQKEKCS